MSLRTEISLTEFGEAIGVISEKAGHENAKSKYPDNIDPLWKEPRAPVETEEIEKQKEIEIMQTRHSKKRLSFIPCMVLIVAMALLTTGCNGRKESGISSAGTQVQAESGQLGEGSTVFSFTVTDQDGNETPFEIHTDKETVGEALLELGMIEGDESEYGLYVKTVNGITADYDADGVYWAFYINDEYAPTGVDSTIITEGDRYAFRIE